MIKLFLITEWYNANDMQKSRNNRYKLIEGIKILLLEEKQLLTKSHSGSKDTELLDDLLFLYKVNVLYSKVLIRKYEFSNTKLKVEL